MRYSFYPGCSMEGTAIPYRISLEAVFHALNMELQEIPDWNCCGATMVSGITGRYPAQVLAARNLALAEALGQDILVPCSSCYLNLAVVNRKFLEDPNFKGKANAALNAAGLHCNGAVRVRQIMEVLVQDIGLEKIRNAVKNPLQGLRVAGYVGCQTPRAFPWQFDDPEQPVYLDHIIECLGATPVHFPKKAWCCGGSHSLTNAEIILDTAGGVLDSALQDNAQIIVTTCPMCQLNLDVHQDRIVKRRGQGISLPVLFITQLMAMAFDLPAESMALRYNIISPQSVLKAFDIKI